MTRGRPKQDRCGICSAPFDAENTKLVVLVVSGKRYEKQACRKCIRRNARKRARLR